MRAGLIVVMLTLVGAGCAAWSLAPVGRAPLAAAATAAPPPPARRIAFARSRSPAPPGSAGANPQILSLLNVTGTMHYGDWAWEEAGVAPGPVVIRIDLARQLLSAFRGGHEIGTAVILYGLPGKPTPAGAFTILQKAADYRSRTYDAAMPYMLRLTADGVAIHGASVHRGAATHGCIGVPLGFARRLYGAANLGDRVVIAGAT